MSPRSAYLLLDAPGADGFAEAWDKAIDEGVEPRHSDALAIALIGGQDKSIDDYSRTATSRRRYRQDMAELDRQ